MRVTAPTGVLLALWFGGCTYSAPATPGDDTPPPDAPGDTTGVDTPVDADPNCAGSPTLPICLASMPADPLTLDTEVYDTDTCDGGVAITNAVDPAPCVRAGTDVTIQGNTFRAEGARPLVIVALNDLAVPAGAYLDVSSFAGVPAAAGADFSGCVAGTPAGNDNNGGGGGAGGSFGTQGGKGGNGPGAAGATPGPADPNPTRLRGGCRGSTGGIGNSAGGSGGSGGGALYLIANGHITIDGAIDASAAGGFGGPSSKNGGGGGGSGGMIALYAKLGVTIDTNALVFANGGGGGGGGGSSIGGGDGSASTGPNIPGAGGPTGGAGGSNGAIGAIPPNPGATANNASSKGAGGGGGGLGVIVDLSPP